MNEGCKEAVDILSFLKGKERAGVKQTDIGKVSMVALRALLKNETERT
jgi:hypothetical protein